MTGITDVFAIDCAAFPRPPYSDETDFAPISMVMHVPFALMVGTHRREITNVGSFVREAWRETTRLSHASSGVASSSPQAFCSGLRSSLNAAPL